MSRRLIYGICMFYRIGQPTPLIYLTRGGLYMKYNKVDLVKDEVSEVIINTKNILVDFGDRIKLEQTELPKITTIKKQLNNVKKELDKINLVVNNICILYEEFEGYLKEQQEELEANNIVLVSSNKDQLILLIDKNLPDGMGIRRLEDIEDTWKIIYSIAEKENFINKKKKSERIPFYKREEKVIGEMVLIESHDNLLLRIKMEDEANYHEFRIGNSLKYIR